MMQFGLIGVGAGAASALLFASVTSGAWQAILLFYLAPLPILIACLGWGHWAALVASATGGLALGLVLGPLFLVMFLAIAGFPAWWLGYLAMLARPIGNGGGTLEWYPAGRLVAWAAILAALVVIVAIPNFGTDGESFRAGFRGALSQMLQLQTGQAGDAPLRVPGITNPDRLLDFFVAVLPATAAVLATITNLVNLWLAARIVKFSGLLKRPWPPLATMTFPRALIAALAIAMALSFLGGLTGILAGVVSASLLMAYAVLGFAVLHAVTQGMNARGFLLGGVYAAVLIFGWPVLGLCLLGLIDVAVDLRTRIAGKRGPPAPT